jgi:hypothetical protein
MKHPVIVGNLIKPTGEKNEEKSEDIARVYYRGSLINSSSNCKFFRAQGFTKVEARNFYDKTRSWDLCGHPKSEGKKQSAGKE